MELLKVVTEVKFDQVKPTCEEINGLKKWTLEGIGIQMNTKNGNDRLYVSEPMLEQLYDHIENYLKKNRSVGELNHPDKPEDQIRINPERISHKFTEIKIDDNDVYLKAVIVNGNPCGDVVANLLNAGVQLGYSSRALAKLIEKRDYVETHCRKIISPADIVYDPSCGADAFIQGVLESKDWVYQNGVIMEAVGFDRVIESCKTQFNNMTNKTKDQVVLKVFKEYFSALKKSK